MAFANNETVEGIVVPDTVEYIRDGAFGNCENLKYVVLSKNLKAIEEGVFVNTRIKEITFPGTLSDVGANGEGLLGLQGATINVESGVSDNILGFLNAGKDTMRWSIVQK